MAASILTPFKKDSLIFPNFEEQKSSQYKNRTYGAADLKLQIIESDAHVEEDNELELDKDLQ